MVLSFKHGFHNDFKRLNGRSLEAILRNKSKIIFLNDVSIYSCLAKLSFVTLFVNV